MVTSASRAILAALLSALVLTIPARVQAQSSEDPSSRQFGAWLDDASAPVKGEGQATIAVGHWRTPSVTQTDTPMLAAGIGLSDRLQVSGSVPFYRVNLDGSTFSGMDSVYIGAKYNLIDPTLSLSEAGLSIGCVLEVLSPATVGGRAHFVIPVSGEIRRTPFRFYGSAGYFSRGAFFSGGAVEWVTPHGVVLTGSLTQSRSMQANASLDALEMGRQRVDVSGSVSTAVGRQAAAFASVGRSLTSVADGGSALALTGGISFWFRLR
jgi:hypothetical protein